MWRVRGEGEEGVSTYCRNDCPTYWSVPTAGMTALPISLYLLQE